MALNNTGYLEGVPCDIKEAATVIVERFKIKGICDPMYICNVIASETKRGDGKGHFTEMSSPTPKEAFKEAAIRLQFAYSSLISVKEIDELASILEKPQTDAITSAGAYFSALTEERRNA